MELRALMFRNVYENPVAKKEEEKAIKMLSELYEYYTRPSGGNVQGIQRTGGIPGSTQGTGSM